MVFNQLVFSAMPNAGSITLNIDNRDKQMWQPCNGTCCDTSVQLQSMVWLCLVVMLSLIIVFLLIFFHGCALGQNWEASPCVNGPRNAWLVAWCWGAAFLQALFQMPQTIEKGESSEKMVSPPQQSNPLYLGQNITQLLMFFLERSIFFRVFIEQNT